MKAAGCGLTVFLVLAIVSAACGGGEQSPLDVSSTNTPVPATATPAPEPTPTPVPTATPQPTTTAGPTSTPASGGAAIKQYPVPPPLTIDVDKSYTARLNTNRGTIEIELFPKEAPKTVNNFIFLARDGFYDGAIFHRVIKDFMIQSGDPTGTGAGGPGYRFEDEFVASLVFDRSGLLAMANGGPNTNGSQFFITLVPTPWLDGRHTIFGQVLSGQGIVDDISLVSTDSRDKPLEPVIIENIEIIGQ